QEKIEELEATPNDNHSVTTNDKGSIGEWRRAISTIKRIINQRKANGTLGELLSHGAFGDLKSAQLTLMAAKKYSANRAIEIREANRVIEAEKMINSTQLPPPPQPRIIEITEDQVERYTFIASKMGKTLEEAGYVVVPNREEQEQREEPPAHPHTAR
ncbi:MAG TPA: hypothetical protein VFS97_11915, partial [Nitrososphaeraceae archaeon]|nr:hypothetical protein [Nitrososphaeraceae archaeon]